MRNKNCVKILSRSLHVWIEVMNKKKYAWKKWATLDMEVGNLRSIWRTSVLGKRVCSLSSSRPNMYNFVNDVRMSISHEFQNKIIIHLPWWLTYFTPRTSTCPTKVFAQANSHTPRDLSNKSLSQYGEGVK